MIKKISVSFFVLALGLVSFSLLAPKVFAGEKCWDYYDYSTENIPTACAEASASKTNYTNPYSCTAQPFPEELKAVACPDGGVFPSIVGYYCHDTRRSCYPGYHKPNGSFYCVNSLTATETGFITGSSLGCDGKAELIYKDRPQYSPNVYAPTVYCCASVKTPANTAVGQGFFSRFGSLFTSFGKNFGKKVKDVFTGGTKSMTVSKAIKPNSIDSNSKGDPLVKTVTVRVYANEHVWSRDSALRNLLDTGMILKEGDTLTISVDPNQKWNIGPDDQHACTADGCSAFGETDAHSGLGVNFTYGSLVGFSDGGLINGQSYFQAGTNFIQIVGKKLAGGNGKLYLIIWDDVPSDNSGYLDVTITTKRPVASKIKIEGQESVAVPKSSNGSTKTPKSNFSQTGSRTLTVYAKDNAVASPLDTGIDLKAGDAVSFKTSGVWSLGALGESNANGLDSKASLGTGSILPYGSLAGRIGDDKWFIVGADESFTAPSSGRLYLSCWDDQATDNSGFMTVAVSISGVPAGKVLTPATSDQKTILEKSSSLDEGWALINSSRQQLEQMKQLQNSLPSTSVGTGKITDDLYLDLIIRATTEAKKDPNGYILTMRSVYAKYGITEIDLANYSKELAKDPARAQNLMNRYYQEMAKIQ